jgi:hypothetical protein
MAPRLGGADALVTGDLNCEKVEFPKLGIHGEILKTHSIYLGHKLVLKLPIHSLKKLSFYICSLDQEANITVCARYIHLVLSVKQSAHPLSLSLFKTHSAAVELTAYLEANNSSLMQPLLFKNPIRVYGSHRLFSFFPIVYWT